MAITKGKVQASKDLERNSDWLSQELGVDRSFDVIRRDLIVADRKAALFFVDGFAKDDIMQRLLHVLSLLGPEDLRPSDFKEIFNRYLSYIEVESTEDLHQAVDRVLAGPLALIIDGIGQVIIIDAREYPVRGPEEPDLERVVRGSRDGFVETIIFNTALVRRRVRDPKLRMEILQVGSRSKTDICISYIEDVADPRLVKMLKEKIEQIKIDGIPMAEKSVEELITPGNFWNPFPRVRYTERPDVAAVHLLEGHILVMVDTSPSVMILPVTLFHHLQHAEEFRQAPMVGVFIRWLRYSAVFFSVFLMPAWLLFATNPQLLPQPLSFIGPSKPGTISLPVQFVFAELGINLMRMAAIHTPQALTTALGLIAAVLIGDIAITVGLFSPETVLYTAIAAVSIFATPSFELGAANTLVRFLLIISVGLFGLPGFAGVVVLVFILLLGTKSFGVPYLWPLIPFNYQALRDVFIRPPVPLQNLRFYVGDQRDRVRQSTPGASAKPFLKDNDKVDSNKIEAPRRRRKERIRPW